MTSFHLEHPDMSGGLVHFTGRSGAASASVESDVLEMTPAERLESIMNQGVIVGYESYGSELPVVCLCDGSWDTLDWLISCGRYAPWGVMLDKDLVYDQGGSPAYYVRHDEWNSRPDWARGRAVRLEPGVADWTHEREWRVPLAVDEPVLRFSLDNVKALLIGEDDWSPSELGYVVGPTGEWEPGRVAPDWLQISTYVWNGEQFVER